MAGVRGGVLGWWEAKVINIYCDVSRHFLVQLQIILADHVWLEHWVERRLKDYTGVRSEVDMGVTGSTLQT